MKRPFHPPWSAEEIARLLSMRARGYTFGEIGAALGRSENAAWERYQKERPCTEKMLTVIRSDEARFARAMGNKRFEDHPLAKPTRNPRFMPHRHETFSATGSSMDYES